MDSTSIAMLENELWHDGGDAVLKDFPTEVFPESVSTFIREASDSIVCPPELIGVPLLVMLGSAIGSSRVIQLKQGWSEGATLYAACVARPGDKKSPAASEAMRPARKEQARVRKQYQREQEQYERDSRDSRDGDFKKPVMARTLVEDTTVEALAMVLNENPRGVLVHRDELSAWIRSMDQYKQVKGSDRQFWLSSWSSAFVAVDRKGQQEPIMLDRPFVSVYGSIQPGVLPELGAGREDGLLDRFLFAYPDPMPSRWSDVEINQSVRDTVHGIYSKLRDLHMVEDDYGDPAPSPVYFDADAKQVFVELVNNHREEMEAVGFSERLRGPWSKLEAYLARLTLVLSLVRSVSEGLPERIELNDVLKAHVLLEYFKDQARKVYNVLFEANPIDQLAIDVVRYVQAMGGHVKDEPGFIHQYLRSEHKPERPEELTKWLLDIAKRTPALEVDNGKSNGRRWLSLTLKIAVPAVPAVPVSDPLTADEVKSVWPDANFGVTSRYEQGRIGRDEAIEYGTRGVLYAMGRPTEDWQRHAPVVDEHFRRIEEQIRREEADEAPFT